MPDPEIDEQALGLLADYVRFLAPPAPAEASAARANASAAGGDASAPPDEAVARGAALFRQIGCESCHREQLRTGPAVAAESPRAPSILANQIIRPYSDFLLHDLGPALADVCGRDAAPGELRTAPLWGLRHRRRLLHDGRAPDPASAVAAHGGEATSARDAFAALPPDAQAALLRFLESL